MTTERRARPTLSCELPGRHRSPKYSSRGQRRQRRGPARLTVGAAGLTVATAATIAGLSLSAGPAVGEPDISASRPAVTAASKPACRFTAPGVPAAARSPRPAPTPSSRPARAASTRKPGRQASPRRAAAPRGPVKPYLIYDSVLPGALPASHVAAVYATGPYAVPETAVQGHGQVLWIDVRGTDPAADVLDIEPGCASPAAAAAWVTARLTEYPNSLAVLYTSIAEWALVKGEVAGLPGWMQARIRWWIANPTGYPHLVPGSDATQWYWGSSVDISTATSRLLTCRRLGAPRIPAEMASAEVALFSPGRDPGDITGADPGRMRAARAVRNFRRLLAGAAGPALAAAALAAAASCSGACPPPPAAHSCRQGWTSCAGARRRPATPAVSCGCRSTRPAPRRAA